MLGGTRKSRRLRLLGGEYGTCNVGGSLIAMWPGTRASPQMWASEYTWASLNTQALPNTWVLPKTAALPEMRALPKGTMWSMSSLPGSDTTVLVFEVYWCPFRLFRSAFHGY